jgi:hypothetical protein
VDRPWRPLTRAWPVSGAGLPLPHTRCRVCRTQLLSTCLLCLADSCALAQPTRDPPIPAANSLPQHRPTHRADSGYIRLLPMRGRWRPAAVCSVLARRAGWSADHLARGKQPRSAMGRHPLPAEAAPAAEYLRGVCVRARGCLCARLRRIASGFEGGNVGMKSKVPGWATGGFGKQNGRWRMLESGARALGPSGSGMRRGGGGETYV